MPQPVELIQVGIQFFESLSIFDQWVLGLMTPVMFGFWFKFYHEIHKANTNGIPHIQVATEKTAAEIAGMRADFKEYYQYMRGMEAGKREAVEQVREDLVKTKES
jgi:hypothetical protein